MKKLNKEQIENLHKLITEELIKKIRYTGLINLRYYKYKEKVELREQQIENLRKEWEKYANNTIEISTNEKMERLYDLETSNKKTLNYLKELEIETIFLIFKKLEIYEKQIKEIIELSTIEKNEKTKIKIENEKINCLL